MKKPVRHTVFLCCYFFFQLSYGQLPSKAHACAAGFKILHLSDISRTFKPNSSPSDRLHYRPVDVDIWYPAKISSFNRPLLFGDFLGLLESRAKAYGETNKWNGVTEQVAGSFCNAFKCSDTSRLLVYKTLSIEAAPPAEGRFPLVVYLASYNSMCYENIKLFEELATKGFVVASISSVGRYPGDMTMKFEDIMEQVQDAACAIKILSSKQHIDGSKIGVVGYSWGGLAGALLAALMPKVACIVSLDGSEFHHYGQNREENQDFEEIKNSEPFKAMHLSAPYLRLQSVSTGGDSKDSVYDFTRKVSENRTVLVVDGADHQDFCYLPVLVRASGGCKGDDQYETITELTEAFLDKYLGGKDEYSAVLEKKINKTVRYK